MKKNIILLLVGVIAYFVFKAIFTSLNIEAFSSGYYTGLFVMWVLINFDKKW